MQGEQIRHNDKYILILAPRKTLPDPRPGVNKAHWGFAEEREPPAGGQDQHEQRVTHF